MLSSSKKVPKSSNIHVDLITDIDIEPSIDYTRRYFM